MMSLLNQHDNSGNSAVSLLNHHHKSGNATIGSLVSHCLYCFLLLQVSTISFDESNVPGVPSTWLIIFEVWMEGDEQNKLWSPESGESTALTFTFILGTCEYFFDSWNAQDELHNAMFSLSKSCSNVCVVSPRCSSLPARWELLKIRCFQRKHLIRYHNRLT